MAAAGQTLEKKAKKKKIALTGNYAVAYAVKSCDVDVVAAYPITPQSPIVEKISEYIANGEMDAEMIHVESEHSALSALVGASAFGARVFTATSSQGLEFMHEILYIASGLRLPIVMALSNRALSAPLNIWNDYGDAMSARDAGWIMIFDETVQEAHDAVVIAYRIAEHPDVLLPVMITLDGFILSHTVEPVEPVEKEEALKFAPKRPRGYRPVLDPDKPVTMGVVGTPDYYYEFKRQQAEAMKKAVPVIDEAFRDFCKTFGRCYERVETYKMDDAEYVLISMGATFGNVRAAVDKLRKEGVKAGGLKIKVFRPFPADLVAKYLGEGRVKAVGVLDRAVSFGAAVEGPLFMEVVTSLAVRGIQVPLVSFVHGLGGRDIFTDEVVQMFKILMDHASRGRSATQTYYIGVRE
ncbi:pyruvate flavodoxin/ferredoxin oxidoreductase domain protein [Pyrolobus fumarii 1A]|uniref:2-oxoacid oxidoreductase (ferredoxin) n=1 Tax=Pyrolobus fumarii (strain DSM 11204 / 1A) TaxID=694429 RepID=G0ED19_PYRF1|nr:pyruvate flavodoxin/ferredoxin oxidoreductase domain containing protein [Pyrolobus fumarii]AEM38578.1 pyruvate flavodoxin/ferredoxin oxidoreductase domain protein [Pyrolobus fumarii 1A]